MRRFHAPTLPNEQLHPLVQLGALPCHPNSGAERPFYSLNDTSERRAVAER